MVGRETSGVSVANPYSQEAVQPSESREDVAEKAKKQAELRAARLDVAKIYAKNRSRITFREDREAVNKYNRLVVEHGQEELAERLKSAENNGSRRQILVLEYILDMQRELGEEIDKQTESSRFYRFRKAFSNFMNRGSKVARFAKKKGLTIASGAIGAAGGVFGAAAGVALSESVQSFSDHRFISVKDRSSSVDMKKIKETATKDGVSVSQPGDISRVFYIAQDLSMTSTEEMIWKDKNSYYTAMGKAAGRGAIAGGVTLVVGAAFSELAPSANATELVPTGHSGGLAYTGVDNLGVSGTEPLNIGVDSGTLELDNLGLENSVEADNLGLDSVGETDNLGIEDSADTDNLGVEDPAGTDNLGTEDPAGTDNMGVEGGPEQPDVNGGEIDSTGMFEFDYAEAPEHLLEEVVNQQLGESLSDAEAYNLINHLMTETNGNIFEGVRTEWNVPGEDVWIMDPGGQTSGLTNEAMIAAKQWLAQGSTGLPASGV